MACDAKIRPFRPVNETEVQCELDHAGARSHAQHTAVLRDYAHPGSATKISWFEEDRRTFRGNWTPCPANCTLPGGHRGNHAP